MTRTKAIGASYVETTTNLGTGKHEVPTVQHFNLEFFYIGKFLGRLFGNREQAR
ncbi:MAG TPA: hypothetical protein VFA90_04125 [Terriglobales bacterium]|nr:hypothetical protein [Terriglobales bacterium]